MFLDANIFINAYFSNDRYGKAAKSYLERVVAGEQNATTSPFVVNEVLFFFMDNFGIEKTKEIHKNICSMQSLSILNVDGRAVGKAMDYIHGGLDVTDAFHAATMDVYGIDVICSYDKAFDKVKGIKRQEPK